MFSFEFDEIPHFDITIVYLHWKASNTSSEEARVTRNAIELSDNTEAFHQPFPFGCSLDLGDASGQAEREVLMDESEDYADMPPLILGD